MGGTNGGDRGGSVGGRAIIPSILLKSLFRLRMSFVVARFGGMGDFGREVGAVNMRFMLLISRSMLLVAPTWVCCAACSCLI